MNVSASTGSGLSDVFSKLRDRQRSGAQYSNDLRELQDFVSCGRASSADAQANRNIWDSNQDNNLTKSELSESLTALEKNIKEGKVNKSYSVNEMIDESADIDDISLLDKMSASLNFGRQLLDNFEAIAKMDTHSRKYMSDIDFSGTTGVMMSDKIRAEM